MQKPSKPKFEVTPTVMMGCSIGMVVWLLLMGVIMVALKMGAGSS